MKEEAKLIDSYDNMVVFSTTGSSVYFYINKIKFCINLISNIQGLPDYSISKFQYSNVYGSYYHYRLIESDELLTDFLYKMSKEV